MYINKKPNGRFSIDDLTERQFAHYMNSLVALKKEEYSDSEAYDIERKELEEMHAIMVREKDAGS